MMVDHCVLPTATLGAARERLEALGFTVAPDARHPFGTANCCVFFEDGSYLEPLAVADRAAAQAAADADNTFVLRDRLFRLHSGEEGFSALVLRTQDAAADHARFVEQGISAGPPLSFSRPMVDRDGVRGEASFRLAFAAPDSPACFFFTCERVAMPATGARLSQGHDNGALGIAKVLAVAGERQDDAAFLARLFAGAGDVQDWSLGDAVFSLLAPREARRLYGIETGGEKRLRLAGIVFRVRETAVLLQRLAVAKIAHTVHEGSIVVPPAPGQGAHFIFEEPAP